MAKRYAVACRSRSRDRDGAGGEEEAYVRPRQGDLKDVDRIDNMMRQRDQVDIKCQPTALKIRPPPPPPPAPAPAAPAAPPAAPALAAAPAPPAPPPSSSSSSSSSFSGPDSILATSASSTFSFSQHSAVDFRCRPESLKSQCACIRTNGLTQPGGTPGTTTHTAGHSARRKPSGSSVTSSTASCRVTFNAVPHSPSSRPVLPPCHGGAQWRSPTCGG